MSFNIIATNCSQGCGVEFYASSIDIEVFGLMDPAYTNGVEVDARIGYGTGCVPFGFRYRKFYCGSSDTLPTLSGDPVIEANCVPSGRERPPFSVGGDWNISTTVQPSGVSSIDLEIGC